jgi:hypothetical protein
MADLDLKAIWNGLNVEVRKASINRQLWEAAAAAVPLVVEDGKFVAGLSPANMRLAGYLTTPQNRRQVETYLKQATSQNVELTVIEGETAEAWERYKERMQVQVEHARGRANFRTEPEGALGVWEKLSVDMHRMFTDTQLRRFPEELARLLIRLLPVIAEAEDTARGLEPEAEQVHFTHLNRAFDKAATYADMPAPMVALEYIRYRASRRRREG